MIHSYSHVTRRNSQGFWTGAWHRPVFFFWSFPGSLHRIARFQSLGPILRAQDRDDRDDLDTTNGDETKQENGEYNLNDYRGIPFPSGHPRTGILVSQMDTHKRNILTNEY